MNPEAIQELKSARESLCQCRSEIAQQIAAVSYGTVENAEKLTKVLLAIEAIDRALSEAGQPYMSDRLRVESDGHSAPRPNR